MSIATTPEEVLDFWFGEPAHDQAAVLMQVRRWFRGGPEFDAEVRLRFGDTVHAALSGALDAWADTPRGRLALVLVLDQLTRNVFRGDARTYLGDEKARTLAVEAFETGLDTGLSYIERLFLSMPLLHSEDIEHHRRLAAISESLTANPPSGYEPVAAMNREQIGKYAATIERFGRFPHRNALLGRRSTPEEEEFLRDWAERGPPRVFVS